MRPYGRIRVALGLRIKRDGSPERARQAPSDGLCRPFRAFGFSGGEYPGRRSAAIAAPLCPGLSCDCPFGAKKLDMPQVLIHFVEQISDRLLATHDASF